MLHASINGSKNIVLIGVTIQWNWPSLCTAHVSFSSTVWFHRMI